MRRGLIPRESLKELMEGDFFDRMFSRSPFRIMGEDLESPAVDLIDKKDRLIAKVELPGINKEDLNVEVEDGLLKIRGERKKEEEVEDKDYYRCERYYGSFSRNVKLPDAVDKNKVKASYKDGILTVDMPKSKEAKSRQINIEVN